MADKKEHSPPSRTLSALNHDRLVDLAEDKITGIDVWLYELNDFLRSANKDFSSDALVTVILELDSIGKKLLQVKQVCNTEQVSVSGVTV